MVQRLLAGLTLTFALGLCAAAQAAPTLTAFASDAELAALFAKWRDEAKRRQVLERQRMMTAESASSAAPAAPAAKLAQSADKAGEDSVTNVQHAGVDEGGIVKTHGDHLVILRRGRLFTIAINDRSLTPISSADAFGSDIDPRGAWYDEMLIADGRVVVIGYSYARGGTEIGVFTIAPSGQLAYQATYHLRSNDYYSSRNYASRLIGSKLILYSPLGLNPYAADPFASFPALRRWTGAGGEFKRIAPATRIYRTDDELDPFSGLALHTVSICDLAKSELDCESTAVMGGVGRVFYVSSSAVYVWTTNWSRRARAQTSPSALFRIPLDGAPPTALKVAGSPIDQFSFLEADGFLNVLVRSEGRGDGMWAGERSSGDLGLLRLALASFADGRASAPASAYRPLPRPQGHAIQSRYVGPYLLYGAGAGWHRPSSVHDGAVFAVRYAESGGTYTLALPHAVDRIEALGRDAVVIGSNGRDLHFSSVRLARHPVLADRYTRANAAQGETRSHGFFYRPMNDQGGLVGLPIIGGGEAAAGQLRRASASVLFLRNEGLRMTELGALDSRTANVDDGCRASCVDWYGNSRPLFVRGRVFALMGYEIVEGRIDAGLIVEARRIDFAPRAALVSR